MLKFTGRTLLMALVINGGFITSAVAEQSVVYQESAKAMEKFTGHSSNIKAAAIAQCKTAGCKTQVSKACGTCDDKVFKLVQARDKQVAGAIAKDTN